MRILLIRTSALGDIVQCFPTLRALRCHFPAAVIGWVVEHRFAPLLENDPDLDQVLEVSLRTWRKAILSRATWSAARDAVREIRAFSADVVLDLMGNHKAGVIAFASSCRRRVGLRRQDRREPSSAIWMTDAVQPIGVHSVERAFSVASVLLGVEGSDLDFGASKILAAGRRPETPLPDSRYAVIHPGAAWPNKRYPAEKWGEVAKLLSREAGLEVLISVGPEEEELGQTVLDSSSGSAWLAAEPSLPGLVSLLHGAVLVLAGDTGPMHLAHALGTPVVALMGPTHPEVHGPYGAPDRALSDVPHEAPHQGRAHVHTGLQDIAPHRVLAKARAVLDGV